MRKLIPEILFGRVIEGAITMTVFILIVLVPLSDVLFSQQKTRTWRGREGKVMEYELVNEIYLGEDINELIYTKRTSDLPQKPRYIKRRSMSNSGVKSHYKFVKADDFEPVQDVGKGGKLKFSSHGSY